MDEKNGNLQRGGRGHKSDCGCGVCLRIRNAKPKPVLLKTEKQRKFVKGYSDPNSSTFQNATQSAVQAGYSPDSAASIGSQLLKNGQIQRSVTAALERKGIGDDFLADGLIDGMRAEETRYFSDKGIVTDERQVKDYHARAKFQDMTHRLRGDFPKDEPVQLASLILKIGDGPLPPAEWEELANRERRIGELLSERLIREGHPGDVEKYAGWRKEAEAQVRAELATPKVPEQLEGPAE